MFRTENLSHVKLHPIVVYTIPEIGSMIMTHSLFSTWRFGGLSSKKTLDFIECLSLCVFAYGVIMIVVDPQSTLPLGQTTKPQNFI